MDYSNQYASGNVTPHDGQCDSMPSEVLLIQAETVKEARRVMQVARDNNHFTPYIEKTYSQYDCTGAVFTADIVLKRLDDWSFIAIHSFGIDV